MQLGNYTLGKELGRGGYATVYLATHRNLHNQIALKQLHPHLVQDTTARARFIQEAQLAASLDHPHIVQIFDLHVTPNYEQPQDIYLTSAYLDGGSLKTRLAEPNTILNSGEALEILNNIADALDHAHAHDLIHRDVKPSNILFDLAGSAYLADFGLVQAANTPRLTKVGGVVGSPTYIAPEQASGQSLDGRTDQYSLAVVAFEMLVGAPPFSGASATSTTLMHVTDAPPAASSRNATIPTEVDAVLNRALAKQSAERYANCAAFVAALKAAYADSALREYRQSLAACETAMAEGALETATEQLETAEQRLLALPQQSINVQALAQIRQRLQQHIDYAAIQANWQQAQSHAENTLALAPDYPDPQRTFALLGLRKPQREWPSGAELYRQISMGALLGAVACGLFLYFAFRLITLP